MEVGDKITVEVIALDQEGNGLAHRGDNIITIPNSKVGDEKEVVLKKKTVLGYEAELLEETNDGEKNGRNVPGPTRGEGRGESSEETRSERTRSEDEEHEPARNQESWSEEEKAIKEWLAKAEKVQAVVQPRNSLPEDEPQVHNPRTNR